MRVIQMNLKLAIELIPENLWYCNLRSHISRYQWEKIRRQVLGVYDNTCFICGARPNKLDIHEVWDYNEKNKILTLQGFMPLCKSCHRVKHIGLTQILASQGLLNMDLIIAHFLNVNKCDINTFDEHYKYAFDQFENRSKDKWKLNLRGYAKYVIKRNR